MTDGKQGSTPVKVREEHGGNFGWCCWDGQGGPCSGADNGAERTAFAALRACSPPPDVAAAKVHVDRPRGGAPQG